MPRPRRPVLAAVCAVLLLAVVAGFARSQYRSDRVIVDRGTSWWRVGVVRGEIRIWENRLNRGPKTFAVTAASDPVDGWYLGEFSWDRFAARGAVYEWELCVPLWSMLPFPLAGVGWSWWGWKAGVGFPVKNVTAKS